MTSLATAACAAILPLALAGCASTLGAEPAGAPPTAPPPTALSTAPSSAPTSASTSTPSPALTSPPSRSPQARPESEGRPRRAALTVPAIGVRALPVLPYRGSPDDAPGTRIQDRGVAASPHGPGGGTGPGGIGNYIVTAHRTSSTRAFEDLPDLRVGERVHVEAAGTRYTYRITTTRRTSFRSARSLARQAAAAPGHPGRRPTDAMITLSTCATPEDHAAGNYWSDELGNPEHRIDKVGVLVAVRSAP